MNRPVVLIGVGEMGGVFARGILRMGYPVFPVTRVMDISGLSDEIENPEMVLVAVGENDLQAVLQELPNAWRDRVCMLQNELLPRDWAGHSLDRPTVISVWFEKKKGMDYKVLIPSPVYGPKAVLIEQSLGALDIPVKVLSDQTELLNELVLKNVYILTTNICGLVTRGNVLDLWNHHNDLAREVANEVMDIQDHLTGVECDRESMVDGFLNAIDGDPEHMCMGRSAPQRLARALTIADEAGLAVPKMREIQAGLD